MAAKTVGGVHRSGAAGARPAKPQKAVRLAQADVARAGVDGPGVDGGGAGLGAVEREATAKLLERAAEALRRAAPDGSRAGLPEGSTSVRAELVIEGDLVVTGPSGGGAVVPDVSAADLLCAVLGLVTVKQAEATTLEAMREVAKSRREAGSSPAQTRMREARERLESLIAGHAERYGLVKETAPRAGQVRGRPSITGRVSVDGRGQSVTVVSEGGAA